MDKIIIIIGVVMTLLGFIGIQSNHVDDAGMMPSVFSAMIGIIILIYGLSI